MKDITEAGTSSKDGPVLCDDATAAWTVSAQRLVARAMLVVSAALDGWRCYCCNHWYVSWEVRTAASEERHSSASGAARRRLLPLLRPVALAGRQAGAVDKL